MAGATLTMKVGFDVDNTADEFGPLTRAVDLSRSAASGSAAGQVNAACSKMSAALDVDLTASGTADIDLQSLNGGPVGTTLSFGNVWGFAFEAPSSNGDAVELTPHATNGWTSFIKAAGDAIILEPGAVVMVGGADFAVGASNKVLTATNTDSGDAAILRVIVIGRTS